MVNLIGYQLSDRSGNNIQGDIEDPTGLASFEVMSMELADHIMRLFPGFLLMPIGADVVEEPTLVGLTEWIERS